MPKVTAHMSISLDGYVAGPHQTREEPLGVRGEELHTWHFGSSVSEVDKAMTERILAPRGAYVMGRNMYAPTGASGARRCGGAGGARSRRTTARCSCSPTTPPTRSR